VCTYHGVWYRVKPDQVTREPVLAEVALEIHTYNIEDQDGQSEPDSNNEQQMDPINDEIRRSPVNISPTQAAAPVMSMTRTQPVITVQAGGGNAPPSRSGTPPQMGGMTLASLQNRLNMVLRQTGPPGGGGGPGGPGGPGRPGGVPTIGQLP
jgi:hypothetical protein